MPQQKPATHQHKVHPEDQTFAHPRSKPHKEQQQDQSYQHLDASAKAKHIYQSSQHLSMSAKAKHFHMVKHRNHQLSSQQYLQQEHLQP